MFDEPNSLSKTALLACLIAATASAAQPSDLPARAAPGAWTCQLTR